MLNYYFKQSQIPWQSKFDTFDAKFLIGSLLKDLYKLFLYHKPKMQQISIQQKIHFNSGKTFYVPLKSQAIHTSQPFLVQSHAISEVYASPIQPQSYRSISQPLTQTYHQPASFNINLQNTPSNYERKGQSQSYNTIENSQNLKTSFNASQSMIPKVFNDKTTQKKYKNFENNSDQVSGNKHNNKLNFGNTSYLLNTKIQKQQMPIKQALNYHQNISSPQANLFSSRDIRKIHSYATPITISLSKFGQQSRQKRKNSAIPKTAPLPVRNFHQSHSSSKTKVQNKRQPNTITITKKSTNQTKIKQIQSKMSLNNFCEKSTVKVKRQIKSNTVSISNIESNNSFSRYFDTKDVIPPLLNRISYQNIEIGKKIEDTQEYVDAPNLFMDFDKVTSPVLSKNQHITSFVHFDSTLFESENNQQRKKKESSPKQQKKYSMPSILPICLIVITIILLAIQILS